MNRHSLAKRAFRVLHKGMRKDRPNLYHDRYIAEARISLCGRIVSTPFTLLENVALKREDCQTSGSFKWRGVQAQIALFRNDVNGLVCVSTGNTGKAVALAGKMHRLEAHIFCAGSLAVEKRLYIEAHGATIHSDAESFSAAAIQAADFAQAREMIFCSPGSSWPFIYGVATIIPEVFEYDPSITSIFAPIGGGGLVAGLGLALNARHGRKPKLVGVQAANSPYVYHYYHGIAEPPNVMPTVADCLSGDLEPDAIVLALAHDILDDVVLVSEDEMLTAAADLEAVGISIEVGAAAAFAAARRSGTRRPQYDKICAIVSGGAK